MNVRRSKIGLERRYLMSLSMKFLGDRMGDLGVIGVSRDGISTGSIVWVGENLGCTTSTRGIGGESMEGKRK